MWATCAAHDVYCRLLPQFSFCNRPAGLKFNYTQIFDNFQRLGNVDLRKVNMGFEPGEQAAAGAWEGLDKDQEVAHFVKDHNIGGCMIWAMDPSPKQAPTGSTLCPKTAKALNPILKPTYAWGPAPTYTKVNPATGFLNKAA